MTLQIELPAEVKARLEAQANHLGLAPDAYATKLITENLPPVPSPSPAPDERNALGRLFAQWDAEDAAHDPGEIERSNREAEQFMQNLARNRLEMEGPDARKLWP
jgi:hypothetical protein